MRSPMPLLVLAPLLASACASSRLFSTEDLLAEPGVLEAGDEVALYASDGRVLRGVVVEWDRDSIVLEQGEGRRTSVPLEEIPFFERRRFSAGRTVGAVGIGLGAAGAAACVTLLVLFLIWAVGG